MFSLYFVQLHVYFPNKSVEIPRSVLWCLPFFLIVSAISAEEHISILEKKIRFKKKGNANVF